MGAWFALSNGNQHIILIGRTGRIAASNSMMSSLQSYEAHYLTMSRCDIATIEEAHMLKAMNSSMPLNGLIHASACQPSTHFETRQRFLARNDHVEANDDCRFGKKASQFVSPNNIISRMQVACCMTRFWYNKTLNPCEWH